MTQRRCGLHWLVSETKPIIERIKLRTKSRVIRRRVLSVSDTVSSFGRVRLLPTALVFRPKHECISVCFNYIAISQQTMIKPQPLPYLYTSASGLILTATTHIPHKLGLSCVYLNSSAEFQTGSRGGRIARPSQQCVVLAVAHHKFREEESNKRWSNYRLG